MPVVTPLADGMAVVGAYGELMTDDMKKVRAASLCGLCFLSVWNGDCCLLCASAVHECDSLSVLESRSFVLRDSQSIFSNPSCIPDKPTGRPHPEMFLRDLASDCSLWLL